ncbi:hypothetical protein D3C71_1840110 [compost metagenome]
MLLMAPPVVTGICSILLSLTSIRLCKPSAVRCSACCGTIRALSSTPCSRRTRTYMPGSRTPSGLGTSARRFTWPVDGSTVMPVNSSLPGWPYSEPSSRTMVARAASLPNCCSWPLANARRKEASSAVDWVKST